MSEQAHMDAILAALNAALAPTVAYEVDDIPPARPAEYVEVQIARYFGELSNLAGYKAAVGYRVTVYGISQSSAPNARLLLDKCNTALEYLEITVGDETSTPIQFETANPVSPDEGWFSGWADYTYAI